jgi:hypothetical protein
VTLRYLSWPWVTALLAVLSVALHASLIAQYGSAIPADLGDPLLNTWILWWNTQRVPLTEAYWNAPAFAPAPNVLALSETLLGLTWLTTPLIRLGASPAVAYNTMFIVTPVLNGMAGYWLGLTLTARRDAALIGGLALAFAPYHASQLSHLQIEAMFYMPIALVGLHRYWATGDWRWAGLFACAVVMNALTSGYFLVYFSVLAGLVIAWLFMSSRSVRSLAVVGVSLLLAALALLPVILVYRTVQEEWHLGRSINEIERLGADLSSIVLGSPHLALWPITTPLHRAEVSAYPGIAIGGLIAAAAVMAFRARRRDLPRPRWQNAIARGLAAASGLAFVAGMGAVLIGEKSYKVFGVAIDLALLAVVSSPRFTGLVRAGSLPALYAAGAAAAAILALGPVGRVLGHRFWYTPPFSWLMSLPGFDHVRVPARFMVIEAVCLSVLAALAMTRIWPVVTRRSVMATAIVAAAIVIDGWMVVPVVTLPASQPVPVSADLVVELPSHGYAEDVAAMYRAMTHGRPVINGYSGWTPPHYIPLQADLRRDCVASLEVLRDGRSIDAVIWRSHASAAAVDASLRQLWRNAVREETADVIVYRQPRLPSATDAASLRAHQLLCN